MRFPYTRSLAIAATCIFPALAHGAPVTMQCVVAGHGSGWIADQIFFEYDSERDAARVVDGIILHFEKKPKVAEISEDTAKKLVLNWRVDTRVSSQSAKMAYRLAYFKQSGKVTISAHPHGYADNFSARGRCQRIKQALPTS